jgi:hypothetical protein
LGSTKADVLAAYPHAKVLSSRGRSAIQLDGGGIEFGLNYVKMVNGNGVARPPRNGATLEVTTAVLGSER